MCNQGDWGGALDAGANGHLWPPPPPLMRPTVAASSMTHPPACRNFTPPQAVLVDTEAGWRVVPLKKIGEHRKTLLAKGYKQAEDEGEHMCCRRAAHAAAITHCGLAGTCALDSACVV